MPRMSCGMIESAVSHAANCLQLFSLLLSGNRHMRADKGEGLIPEHEFAPGFIRRLFGSSVTRSQYRHLRCHASPSSSMPPPPPPWGHIQSCANAHSLALAEFRTRLRNHRKTAKRALGEKTIHSHCDSQTKLCATADLHMIRRIRGEAETRCI